MPQEAQRQSRGTILLIFNLTPRCGCVVSVMPQPLNPWKTATVSIAQEVWLALGPVKTIVQKTKPLASTGVQTTDCPACSKLPYYIRFPSPTFNITTVPKINKY